MYERRGRRSRFGLVGVALALASIDCGDGGPSVSSSRTEATVRGKVMIRGKATTGGRVLFDPANIQRRDAPLVSGPIGKDGRYEVKTLIGGNTVQVTVPEAVKDPTLLQATIPIDVKEGENTLDISLPLPATP